MANTFLTPHERNLKANAKALRKLIGDIVDRRRSVLANDPSQKNKGDFLTILLTEPFFMNNQQRIIDECLTFFFAGSQTSANATQNLMMALIKNPQYQTQLLNEFDKEIVQEHLKERVSKGELAVGQTVEDIDFLSLLNYENCGNLQLFTNCFNESLRMQPPVFFSSSIRMSQDT